MSIQLELPRRARMLITDASGYTGQRSTHKLEPLFLNGDFFSQHGAVKVSCRSGLHAISGL